MDKFIQNQEMLETSKNNIKNHVNRMNADLYGGGGRSNYKAISKKKTNHATVNMIAVLMLILGDFLSSMRIRFYNGYETKLYY